MTSLYDQLEAALEGAINADIHESVSQWVDAQSELESLLHNNAPLFLALLKLMDSVENWKRCSVGESEDNPIQATNRMMNRLAKAEQLMPK